MWAINTADGDAGFLMRGLDRWPRLPDAGELLGVVLLGVIAVWGIWFGLQSLVTLWWPINVAYTVAGLLVAGVAVAVVGALLKR